MTTINQTLTGENIKLMMVMNRVTYRDIQERLCFNTPQAIYKWTRGKNLPSIDNLVVLAEMFNCKIEDIIILDE